MSSSGWVLAAANAPTASRPAAAASSAVDASPAAVPETEPTTSSPAPAPGLEPGSDTRAPDAIPTAVEAPPRLAAPSVGQGSRQTTTEHAEEVDLADPLATIDVALRRLTAAGFEVENTRRVSNALQGTSIVGTIRGPSAELLQYVLQDAADEGFLVLLDVRAANTVDFVARRVVSGQGRGIAFVNLRQVDMEGEFLRGETGRGLAEILNLGAGELSPASIGAALQDLGYRAVFIPVAPGRITIRVHPGRMIRRVRVHGHIPLSPREVRRVLSVAARPGALALGNCVQPKQFERENPPVACEAGDLVCLAWEAEETQRLERLLFDSGFMKGRADLSFVCGRAEDEADLHVVIDKGAAYKVRRLGHVEVQGNVSRRDARWIRWVFWPTHSPIILVPKRITRTHVEAAKERVVDEYAQPRSRALAFGGGGSRDLQLPYPGVRVDTSYDRLDRENVPSDEHFELTVDVQLGHGVRTAFLGNRRVSETRLVKQLSLFERHEPATIASAKRESINLRNYYQSRGFVFAGIDGRFQDFGALKQLTFVVEEGPRARVRSVDLGFATRLPHDVASEIGTAFRRARTLKPRGRFSDAEARADLGKLLTVLNERGYLCARAEVRLAFWKRGLEQASTRAVLGPTTDTDASGHPEWLERQLDARGLAALAKQRNVGIHVAFHVVPGPRIVTSGKETVFHLEVPIPPDRHVEDLPTALDGAWGAPRLLRRSPLRRKGSGKRIPINLTLAREVELHIIRAYRSSGYPLADASLRWVYRDANGTTHRAAQGDRLADASLALCRERADDTSAEVDTEIYAYEGRRGQFGTTLLRGNFKTRDWVLRREIEMQPGADYDRRLVDKTITNFDGTRVVDSIAVTPYPVGCDRNDDTQTCTVHHAITIDEAKDISMIPTFGAGGTTLDPIYVFLRPTFPNVFGTAWDFQVDGHWGFNLPPLRDAICDGEDCYERSAHASLVRRRIFASPLTFEIQGSIQRRVTPARGIIDSAYGQVRLTYPITRHWQIYFGYLFQVANIQRDLMKPVLGATGCGDAGNQPCAVTSRRQAIVPDQTGAFQTGVLWQRADNPFNPDKGFMFNVDAMLASPWLGGWDWWLRFDVGWQQFIPLPRTKDRVNFRYGLRYGHSIPIARFPGAETASVPEVWRYFGGGTVDLGIRGIKPQTMLSDVEILENQFGQQTLRPRAIGGHIRLLGTVALQVVSVRDFLGGKLAHSVFFDFGVLTQRWNQVVFNRDFRRSVGINFLKWDIRLVTLSLGYAVLIPNRIWPGSVHLTDDRNGRFVFDVGVTF